MDLWSPEQTKKIIGIEQAFEEFCEADPELGRLDSTRPDPKCNPKKFKKWYARYCPVRDDATERFVELFREKILVAIVLQDDKEKVLPPEYWASPLASLTIIKGKVQRLLHDDLGHLENSRVVLHKDDWEKWINETIRNEEKKSLRERAEEWANRLKPAKNKKGGYRAVAKEIASEQGIDHLYIEREARAVRERKRRSGEK